MVIEYRRNITKSYMLIISESELKPFEKELLQRNPIAGLLPFHMTTENGSAVCWYDITGKQAFDDTLQTALLTKEQLIQFLSDFCSLLEQVDSYLLNPQNIMLSPENIFQNNKDGSYQFCYAPEEGENIAGNFQKLLEFILTKIEHKDEMAVKIAYRIYGDVMKEGYSLLSIRDALFSEEQKEVILEKAENRNEPFYEMEKEKTNVLKEEHEHGKGKKDIVGWAKDKRENMQLQKIAGRLLKHFFPDIIKIKERKQICGKYKETEPAVFEPEEEKVSDGRPTILLADCRNEIYGILKYEGDHHLSNMQINALPYYIGSADDCAGKIERETVSRHHAKITKVNDVYFIEDLNSANGTKVGGVLLEYRTKVGMEPNEIIELADEKFRFI